MARRRAVLDGVLGDRKEDHRQHRHGGDRLGDVPRQREERGIAEEVQREEIAHEPELRGERPRRGLHSGEHRAEDRGELEHGALGHLAVFAAPLRDGVQRVEEEMRIEVGSYRQELRVLGLARQPVGPLPLAQEARFHPDVATEPPPAHEEQGRAHREARARGEEGRTHVELVGHDFPEDEDDPCADGGVEKEADGAVTEVDALGEEHAPRERRDEDEGEAHGGAERPAVSVAAVAPLEQDHRGADRENGERPPRLEERAQRAPNDGRLVLARHSCSLTPPRHLVKRRRPPAPRDRSPAPRDRSALDSAGGCPARVLG